MADRHEHVKTLFYFLYLPTGEIVNNPLIGTPWGFGVRRVAECVLSDPDVGFISERYNYKRELFIKNPGLRAPLFKNQFEIVEHERQPYELVY